MADDNKQCKACGYVYSSRFAWCPDCGVRPSMFVRLIAARTRGEQGGAV